MIAYQPFLTHKPPELNTDETFMNNDDDFNDSETAVRFSKNDRQDIEEGNATESIHTIVTSIPSYYFASTLL
jgi:hypothetical protein